MVPQIEIDTHSNLKKTYALIFETEKAARENRIGSLRNAVGARNVLLVQQEASSSPMQSKRGLNVFDTSQLILSGQDSVGESAGKRFLIIFKKARDAKKWAKTIKESNCVGCAVFARMSRTPEVPGDAEILAGNALQLSKATYALMFPKASLATKWKRSVFHGSTQFGNLLLYKLDTGGHNAGDVIRRYISQLRGFPKRKVRVVLLSSFEEIKL